MNTQFANTEQLGVSHMGRRLRGAVRKLTEFIQDDEDFDSYEAQLRSTIELSGMVSPQYDAITLESWD